MVRILAPAKVNLFLRILAQERSGFHQLETLFCRLEFGDTLEIERAAGGIDLEVEGARIGPPEENLVYQAAHGFKEAAGLREGIRILLKKRIPMGAGLGGGSSDAAATLLGLAALFPGCLPEGRLLGIAGALGSDVPFFLSPSPLALAWGRGDRIQPLPPLPGVPAVLALPPVEIPTPWAYGLLAEDRQRKGESPRPHLFSPDSLATWDSVGGLAKNDFEEVIFREYPLLERIRGGLREVGSRMSLLSGSGSALFGLFEDDASAASAQGTLRQKFPEARFLLTRTESRLAPLFQEPPKTSKGLNRR
jgi:4-diphosphocytidyl-2-C-methyl-D-erythritol kinase